MGCRGDGSDLSASHVRVKAVSLVQRAEVELWLWTYFDKLVELGRYEDAARVYREELKEAKKE